MPIEMVWNDLKFFLTDHRRLETKADLMRGIRKFWRSKANDLEYCNSKFNHMPRVVDQIITLCGRATGL
jgi:hypothetical protein